ncbi:MULTISPECIES: TetR/AcrR family transcriptional regulator [unclassified Actinomyces]|uniref:TetR/AcrR family transcriptional regulator n=1 Tax=unclassified Actinomyces TaxID=2609248 RepID=UPI000D58FA4F|nr:MULTISPECIES: TetR/AcrR family transcriptional regulator [unclassified Actinomyces]RAX22822.1 TetR/AcrR family transcriptional regulator [Actinomyces sp. Z3]
MCPPSAGINPDLSTVARIRNAAMVRFAKDGFGAGLRAIAADAGVTAGLITHHFGSKEGLRRACDEEVLRLARKKTEDSEVLGGPVDLLSQMARAEEYLPASAYTLRCVMEGGPLVASLLDSLIADTVELLRAGVDGGFISPSADEFERVRYLVYSGFGALVFFTRYAASDPTDVEAVIREFQEWSGPVAAELYSTPLITSPAALTEYIRAARTGRRPSAGPKPPEQPPSGRSEATE